VSVITATWQRRELLIERCVPSVRAQTYEDWEHLIISDGPDPELAGDPRLSGERLFVTALPEHEGKLGAAPRNHGVAVAGGELLAFLDDDNAYRPRALEVLVAALDASPEAGFAYGRLNYPQDGRELEVLDPPQVSHVDGSTLLARRELFDVAQWEGGTYALDWLLIERWLSAGVRWRFVDEVVLDYYFAR